MDTLLREEYVEWAVQAIVDGIDSPSLRILAGLPHLVIPSEAEHYFQRTLSELGVPLISGEEAIRAHLRDTSSLVQSSRPMVATNYTRGG